MHGKPCIYHGELCFTMVDFREVKVCFMKVFLFDTNDQVLYRLLFPGDQSPRLQSERSVGGNEV